MKGLKDVPSDQRPEVGKQINDLKEEITSKIETLELDLIEKEQAVRLEQEKIDITLPGRRRFSGRKHIITQTMDEIIDVLTAMGFSVQYDPISIPITIISKL